MLTAEEAARIGLATVPNSVLSSVLMPHEETEPIGV